MINENTVMIVLRLANEEVPVNAIARAVQAPSDEVRETIQEAIMYGKVLSMPRSDWHPLQRGNRGENSKLTEEELVSNCQRTFHLTKLHASFLSVLMRRNEVTKITLHQIIESCRRQPQDEETDIKMVDVILCNLRKKLKPFGLQIKTLWSSGYYMEPDVRKKAQDIILERLNGETDGAKKEASYPVGPGNSAAAAFQGDISTIGRTGTNNVPFLGSGT